MFTECFREIPRAGTSTVRDDVAVEAVCWDRSKRDWVEEVLGPGDVGSKRNRAEDNLGGIDDR
jgi:hypothetical protein